MWWIALYLPQWPLEALGIPALDAVEEKGRLCCVGSRAAQAGVCVGMSVPAAQVRMPELKVLTRQPDQEEKAMRALVLAALRFSPHLCWKADGFLIEVASSLRLFGGPLNLWRQIRQVTDAFGHPQSGAAGDGGEAAPAGVSRSIHSARRGGRLVATSATGTATGTATATATAITATAVTAHWAAAPHPEAAWLLARVRGPERQLALRQRQHQRAGPPLGVAQSRLMTAVQPVLDSLPVAAVLQAWGACESVQSLVAGLGVSHLGALRALPRAGLQRRLGAVWLESLDRVYGDAPDPRPYWVPPTVFDERLEFPERSADMAVVGHALQQLLQGLEGWLSHRGRLAQVLALHILHEARRREALPDTVHTLRLAAPERQAAVLQTLWAERLGRHPLNAPAVGLRLVLKASEPAQTQDRQTSLISDRRLQAALDHPFAAHQALACLLDRLRSRLGPHAVLGLRQQDDHRPERASLLLELDPDAERPPRSGPSLLDTGNTPGSDEALQSQPQRPAFQQPPQAHAQPLHQPLWLLAEPEPLPERHGLPMHAGAPLRLRTSADRIEAGWYDGEPVCRDYHVAEGSDHRLCWVFRQHRGDQSVWFLHGWFT